MPKNQQPPIRVTAKDKLLIEKLNKRVSDRKYDVRKRYGEKIAVDTQGITAFNTRAEFNAYKQRIEKFLAAPLQQFVAAKPKPVRVAKPYVNKKGTELPKAELKKLEQKYKSVNAAKLRQEQKIDALMGYEGFVQDRIALGDPKYARFIPLKFNPDRYTSLKEFEEHKQQFFKTFEGNWIFRQDKQFKDVNYLEALREKIGEVIGLDDPDYLRLKRHIEKMSVKKFMQLYYTRYFTSIGFLYDEFEARDKLNRIMSEWELE
jgi:hypothetical protein